MSHGTSNELFDIISQAKIIARRYYELTEKPLGITGEIAEYEAARLLGLELKGAREKSIDATQIRDGKTVRIQIKGRAVELKRKYRGRVPKIKLNLEFDFGLLVLLNKETFEVIEIWEAGFEDIKSRLTAPGSKSRNERNSMGITQFKSIAEKIWSA